MILHDIQAVAAAVEGAQARGIFIGEPSLLEGVRTAADRPELGELAGRLGGTFPGHGLQQCPVGREQVELLERRALIGYLVCPERLEHHFLAS